MRISLREKIILVCDKKILTKGEFGGIHSMHFLPIRMMIQNFLWRRQRGGSKIIIWIILKKL